MKNIDFIDKYGTFRIKNPENYSGLYLPLAGEKGLKSSITPTLGGDSKTSQNTFLLEPVSIENLHNNKGTEISGVGLLGRASGQYADHLHSRRPTDLQVIRMKVSLRQV